MYQVVAGIDVDPSAPGYKHILIQPRPGGGFTHVKARHLTMYGDVRSDWQITGDGFGLSLVIPPNTIATVRLPKADLNKVTESGKSLSESFKGRQDGSVVVMELGSGRYSFNYPWRPSVN